MTADTKECLFCAETIKAAAKKCRFCGEWLDGHTRKPALHDETIGHDKTGGDKTSIDTISNVKGVAIGSEPQAANARDDSTIAQTREGDINIAVGKKLYDADFAVLSQSHASLVQIRNILNQKFRPPPMEEHRLIDFKIRATKALENTATLQRIMGSQWADEYRSIIIDAIITSLKMSKRDMKAELDELKKRDSEEFAKSFFEDWSKESNIAKNLDEMIVRLQEKLNE